MQRCYKVRLRLCKVDRNMFAWCFRSGSIYSGSSVRSRGVAIQQPTIWDQGSVMEWYEVEHLATLHAKQHEGHHGSHKRTEPV
jgi:hypothetical protein